MLSNAKIRDLLDSYNPYDYCTVQKKRIFDSLSYVMSYTNNYYLNSIHFLMKGCKDPQYWEVFFHPFNGRELRKIRQKSFHSKGNGVSTEIALRIFTLNQWRWSNANKVKYFTYKDFDFSLVSSFKELDTISQSLRVCSAKRPDLIEKFIDGTMLRFAIYQNKKVAGTVAIYPNEHNTLFAFYGLSYGHESISEISLNLEEDAVSPALLEAYQRFYQYALKQGLSIDGLELRAEKCFDPYGH